MQRKLTQLLGLGLVGAVGVGCGIDKDIHKSVVDELAKTRTELQGTQTQLSDKQEKLAGCDDKLGEALEQNQSLVTKVTNMGHNVEQLLGEKDKLAEERQRMSAEIEELRRMREAAEQRNAEYRKVLDKLQKMVDAGTLTVKIRGGRMVVQMSSDVIFPPGGTRIKTEAKDAISQLAETMKELDDRKFEVVGHSDATPISTARYPSNWELSSQRAIEVVKLLVENGVPPEMLSAAGNAEFDPLAPNDTDDNKTLNRRVEIVFLPKLDELPGFGDLVH